MDIFFPCSLMIRFGPDIGLGMDATPDSVDEIYLAARAVVRSCQDLPPYGLHRGELGPKERVVARTINGILSRMNEQHVNAILALTNAMKHRDAYSAARLELIEAMKLFGIALPIGPSILENAPILSIPSTPVDEKQTQ